jgi:5-methylcytosine-specific restriction endonuclease McrA
MPNVARKLRSDKTRKCSSCGKTKSLKEFSIDRSRKGGYSYTCKECQAAHVKEYYAQNKEKSKATRKAYREGNPVPRKRALADKYYTEIAFHENRRARLSGVPGTFTGQEFQALCEAFEYRCARCGAGNVEDPPTADHVVPTSLGGENVIGNIQPLCLSCNSKKGARTVDYRRWNPGDVDPLDACTDSAASEEGYPHNGHAAVQEMS